MDFVADQLQDGTRFRSLTVVDIYTREPMPLNQSELNGIIERVIRDIRSEGHAVQVYTN
jgi:putative transposase